MAHLAGKSGYVDTGSVVAGIKSWTLDFVTDALETTDFADAGVKSYIVGGSGWSGSFEGFKDGAPQTEGSSVNLKIYESATSYWYSGTSGALLIGCHPSTDFGGVVSVSYDFQGTGILGHTEA